ncbi:putative capsid [uncultured virus]|uniref:Putative capsid n=1 Tax=uncultured virus TaxID=340016 RepID=A0A2K9LS44_9VIRU|nr:putative capsid [uncultured virus]
MFKKYKRKIFRKKGRSFKKRRFIKRQKTFKKRLNQVAEKKLCETMYYSSNNLLISNNLVSIWPGIIHLGLPGVGTGPNQRVGSKIFIRYVRYRIIITPETTNAGLLGWLGILIIKEKNPHSCQGDLISTYIHNHKPMLNNDVYKDKVNKMKLKMCRFQPNTTVQTGNYVASEIPYQRVFNYKFKIMKECSIQSDFTINIPDIAIVPFAFFDSNYSTIVGTGVEVTSKIVMTYTDV